MMDRRQFLRRAGLIAAGIVAADQLDVLEMLAPPRLFPGTSLTEMNLGFTDILGSSSVWGLSTSTYPRWEVATMSQATIADLYKATNTDMLNALRATTPEAQWIATHYAPPGVIYLTEQPMSLL